MPISEAPGKLKNREDRKVLATEKEKVTPSFVPLTLNILEDYSHIIVLRAQIFCWWVFKAAFGWAEIQPRDQTGLKTPMNV